MTAKDVSLAKAILTAFESATFSNSAIAKYANDLSRPLEDVSKPEIWVSATLRPRRLARDAWGDDATVTVIAMSPQKIAGASGDQDLEDEKDAWLSFIDDELLPVIKGFSSEGRKPQTIEFEQRMDPEKIRKLSLFYTKFQVNFLLV